MKSRRNFYPIIRREFGTIAELCLVIGRKRTYCKDRLAGRGEFTTEERKKIAEYIGISFLEVIK